MSKHRSTVSLEEREENELLYRELSLCSEMRLLARLGGSLPILNPQSVKEVKKNDPPRSHSTG